MIYALLMNDMRHPHVEDLTVVAVSTDRSELVDLCGRDYAPWTDGHWYKTYRQGSQLEWFNEADVSVDRGYWGGIYPYPDNTQIPIGALAFWKAT